MVSKSMAGLSYIERAHASNPLPHGQAVTALCVFVYADFRLMDERKLYRMGTKRHQNHSSGRFGRQFDGRLRSARATALRRN